MASNLIVVEHPRLYFSSPRPAATSTSRPIPVAWFARRRRTPGDRVSFRAADPAAVLYGRRPAPSIVNYLEFMSPKAEKRRPSGVPRV